MPCRPPRSVSGLVWVIGPLLCHTGHVSGVLGFGLGLGGLWRIPCYFPSSSCLSSPARDIGLPPCMIMSTPPPPTRGPGAIWTKLTTHTHAGAQERLAFCANHSLFRRQLPAPPPLAGGMATASVDDLFLFLTAGLPLFFYFFDVPCRLHNLAVQSCSTGF